MRTEDRWGALAHALALARRLEGEGQYSSAKLLRAAGESLARRAAYERLQSVGSETLEQGLSEAIERLGADLPSPELVSALGAAQAALTDGRLPGFDETPDPYICRTCGHTLLRAPLENCPTCGARLGTFKHVRPIYWLTEFDPFETLQSLRETPEILRAALEGIGERALREPAPDGGWSVRQQISHFRDAEGVLNGRLKRMVKQEDPPLESLAVFDWATEEGDRPPETSEIFETYRTSRERTLATLESLPLRDWWRTGRHQEFGPVTIGEQASYFAVHELTHLPQLEAQLREIGRKTG